MFAAFDKLAKVAVAVPAGVAGTALYAVGEGLSTVGFTQAGGEVSRAGSTVVSGSIDVLTGGREEMRGRNNALQAFGKYSAGEGAGAYLGKEELMGVVVDHPELYIGLEGIIGTEAEIQEMAAVVLLKQYGGEACGGTLQWGAFLELWQDVVEDCEGRLAFYHRLIFRHYDSARVGHLTRAQAETLLDDFYYADGSAFSGDKRVPPKEELLVALWETRGDGEGLVLEHLVPLFTGDFCAI